MEEGLAAGRNLKELLGNPKIIFVLGKYSSHLHEITL